MSSEIRNRFTGEIIAESDVLSLRHLVLANIKNLADADLRGVDLSGYYVNLDDYAYTPLNGADFRRADLRGANLSRVALRNARFNEADMQKIDLSFSGLVASDFRDANLRGANLQHSSPVDAVFVGADLADAKMWEADLRGADMTDAISSGVDMRYADLSGTKGLPTSAAYLSRFELDELGVIVYKRIGEGYTNHNPAAEWIIEPGSFLTANTDANRTVHCGCGVNFGTLEWCLSHHPYAPLWKCRVRWMDLADVVVPYNTTGICRAARLELINVIQLGRPVT